MKRFLKKLYSSLELKRYRILANDSVIAFLFRNIIYMLYPILGSKKFLCSKFINYRNRESATLFELINNAAKGNKDLKKDMVLCYYYYHIVPWEYKLYHFEKQSHNERMCWLSDADRYMICELLMSDFPYQILKDKSKFYELLKDFYKRPIFPFTPNTCEIEFNVFLKENHCVFFVKPLDGSLGRDTFKVTTNEEKSNLYNKLKNIGGSWMIEGAIEQIGQMSEWNESSVNTVRIPSIRVNNEWHILQPFFRTGRKGQIVDNAGAGGVLCAFDEKTGIVVTDGCDENSNVYEFHPDSKLRYKGWQIPEYNNLVELTKKIHQNLPSDFLYVGFDFALTEKGWDLIEGNWGQFIGQIATQKGIRKEFEKYMGITQ